VKLPDIYTDWRTMAGLALITLGAVNWAIGLSRTQTYSQIVVAATAQQPPADIRSFDELDSTSGAVLAPFTAEERQVSFATARMDFYHATYLMGRGMVIAGLLLSFWGFLALIKSDARKSLRRGGDSATGRNGRIRSSGRDG
jgi:hypothetical protein